jgi:transcriptional regulator with XRE-family HTH domain
VFADVAHNLRRLRRDRHLTQEQVARFANLHQQQISAIERGLEPSPALVGRLARAIGCHPDELLREACRASAPTTGRD